MPIYAEARIGELLPPSVPVRTIGGQMNGRERLPEGITHRKAHQARTIKDNPEIVAKIKAQAREKLSSRYHRDGSNAPSWNQYCIDIGIPK